MEKLTKLQGPVHSKVFRTDFYDLTLSCYRFVVAEFHLLLAGNKQKAMLDRIPDLEHTLGQGETVAMLDTESDSWHAVLAEYFNVLNYRNSVSGHLNRIDDRKEATRQRLELTVQVLQCYRQMHQLLVDAKNKRTDLN